VLCILGTWCDDSRREVPRMLTILQAMGLKPESFSLIGVARAKRSPGGEAAEHNVSLVPTFIIYRSGVEIGRIIEKPSVTLEHDLLAMLRGEPLAAPAKQQTARPAHEPHLKDPNLPPDPEQQKPADGVEGEIRTQDPPPGADVPRFRNR